VTLANLTALAKAQASLVKPGSGSLARRGTYTDASGKIVTVFMSKTVLALPGGRAMINSGVSFVRGNIVISATGHARDAAKYPETVDLDGMMKLVTQKAFGRLKPSQPLKDVEL